MNKFALLHKFPHWSEVLSVLTYADNSNAEFMHFKRGETYTDPLGKEYPCYVKSHFDGKDTVLIVNGSIHLETHPLSKGKIPCAALPYKLAIEHTTGYSPWDFLQMVDLAEISSKGDPEFAQGSKLIYAMNKKCYDRFMSVDWISAGKPNFEEYKNKIDELIYRGYIVPTAIEPAQFWLENVNSSYAYRMLMEGGFGQYKERSDNICIELNWCNMKKASYAKQILDICEKLHNYTGKDIDIRLHSYTSQSFLKYFTQPYIHLYPYDSISKYDIMDKYKLYFVDGTGLGYETGYRNYIMRGHSYSDLNVDIFYLNGLPSDEPGGGFEGIVEMGAVPDYNLNDFLNGTDHSYYSEKILKESFPHGRAFNPKFDNTANECYQILDNLSNKLLTL